MAEKMDEAFVKYHDPYIYIYIRYYENELLASIMYYTLEHCSNSAITINLWSIGKREYILLSKTMGPYCDAT